MKASIYLSYPTSSLIRGGQRSLLAIFCVAVGVMSLVALQLVGGMLQSTLTVNTRATNGGDIAVAAQAKPFTASDLTFFSQRKSAGNILNYTAVLNQTSSLNSVSITSSTGGGVRASSSSDSFQLDAVDPGNYPLVGQPDFVTPASGTLSSLLTNKQVVVTQTFITSTNHKVGDTITAYIRSQTGTAQALHVTIAGVISNTGGFSQSSSLMLISQATYKTQLSPKSALTYSNVYVTTTDQAQTDATVKALNQHFTQASTQTATDVLKEEQSSIDNVNEFLEIAGLLALLIGGVGIVNTMQVLLSRRKTEIAMLKTAGYRRIDLYALFGLEAGLLGLIGGVIGAAASIGVSAIVRILVQNLGFSVPYVINLVTVADGVIIGIATSLIFGLLPIVQAANIRPLNVIRDTGEKRSIGSTILSIALLILLSVLFCVLAIVILNNNVVLGIEAVYGTFAFLLLLSGLFSLIVLVVSKLPVRNHFSYLHLLFTVIGLVIAALLYRIAPVFCYVICGVTALGLLLIVAPRSWQVSTRLALRNIGRQRSRTTTTMVALFIGIFAIGLVLLLGQDLQTQINTTLAQNLTYNVIVLTSGKDSQALRTQIGEIAGLKKSLVDTYTQAKIKTVNGKALETVKASTSSTGKSSTAPVRRGGGIFGGFGGGGGGGKNGSPGAPTTTTDTSLGSSLEGYDLSKNIPDVTISQGRNLNASDAGTTNILINSSLSTPPSGQAAVKVGDTVTLGSSDDKVVETAKVVGAYSSTVSLGQTHLGSVLVSNQTATALSPAATGVTTITYMDISSAQVTGAMKKLGQIVPNASIENLASIADFVESLLNSITQVLVAIASLSLLAAIVIIANSVALAMLERRREMGILKAVGYTSSVVMNEVIIENGLVGGLSALLALFLASLIIGLVGTLVFKLTLSASPLIVAGLLGGTVALTILTAMLVAWNAVRVRPLAVLRYE